MKNKRIVFLVTMLMALSLGGKVFAQAAIKTYQGEALPMRVHVFSANATVINGFNDGDSISRLWFKPNGASEKMIPLEPYSMTTPAAKTALASLPGDGFYFGEKKMKYFGLTGGGLVYFGETNEMHPTSNPKATVNEDVIFIKFHTGLPSTAISSSRWKDVEVLATANTSVQYEVVADTLFVAYNNVKVLDTGNRECILRFQYALTKDGEVFFIPVSMRPQGDPDVAKAQNIFAFNYGLFAKKSLAESRFLDDLDGKVRSGSYGELRLTKETYPTQTYRMYPPEPCEKVENPTMQWSYTVSSDYIEFNNQYTTWSKGGACLFILSREETLSGANLPVNGTEYSTGSKIGSSILVMKGTFDGNSYMLAQNPKDRIATGLTPGTTYYLHAFPYNNADCRGFVYNTTDIPKRAITTAIGPVNSVSLDVATLTDNGFTLNIDKGDAERYVLAVSRRQILSYASAPLSIKEGGYKAGDKMKFHFKSPEYDESYNLEVLAVSADAKYEVKNVQPNNDYYYYVWSTDAAQTKGSFEYRSCGVSTPYHIPAVFTFDSAGVGLAPAGWNLPLQNDKSFKIYGEYEKRYLSTPDLCPPTNTSPIRIEAISPIIKGGMNVAATVEFYFYKPNAQLGIDNASLRDGDTVFVQYKGLSENTWTTLSVITKANAMPGINTVTTPSFYSSEDFQLRFVAVSTESVEEGTGSNTVSIARAGISKITVSSVCNAISSEHPEVSQIMNDRVTLSWEDEDNTPRAEAYHIRYRLSENDAWTGRISKNRNYTFTGLKNNTYYTMEVAAVCSGDTSDYVSVSFTTLRGLPYKFILASKQGSANPDTLPEGVTLKTGVLPASGIASFTEPDAAKSVWAPTQKSTNYGAGLTVDADLNNPLWLNLPVVSTGITRGKARFSLKLSAWSAADPTQPATFGQNDSLWVLFSTDNKFNRTNAKIKVDWSEVTPQGKTYTLDFDVEDSYQYWAVYTGLHTAGNVLFIDSLNIEWTEIYCNAATGLRQSNLSFRSVDISWKGEGEEYGIVYNNRNTEKWDTVYTQETTYTLDNLEPFTPYQYYIIVYCDVDRLKASDKSAIRYFQTEEECDVPTIEIVEGTETWHGVRVVTKAHAKTRHFRIEAKDIERYPDAKYNTHGTKDTTQIKGLYYYEAIPYYIKVRTLCPRDTSDWSEVKEFTTLPFPDCGVPTDLKASLNVATKTATLSWKAGKNNEGYILYLSGGNIHDTLYSSYPSYDYTGFLPNVVYTWSLMSACAYPLYSDVVKGKPFGTNVGVESVQSFDKAIKVRVFENQIIIENNEELHINSLQAFSMDGKLLKTYPVNSNQNVYIYHTLPKGAALLRVLGENGKTATYKTIIL